MWYHLYVESKNKWIYIQNRNRLTDTGNKFMVTKSERGPWLFHFNVWQNPPQIKKNKKMKKKIKIKVKGVRRDQWGVWDCQIQATTYKTDKQQAPTIQHTELHAISCNNLQWKRTWKRKIYTYVHIRINESLCCTSETNTIL